MALGDIHVPGGEAEERLHRPKELSELEPEFCIGAIWGTLRCSLRVILGWLGMAPSGYNEK